jgi:hypothetical protein
VKDPMPNYELSAKEVDPDVIVLPPPTLQVDKKIELAPPPPPKVIEATQSTNEDHEQLINSLDEEEEKKEIELVNYAQLPQNQNQPI